MATLHLQGGNTMEIPNSSAEIIKSELGTSQAPTFYDIGPVKVKTSTILRVVLEGRQISDEKYLKWRDKVQEWNEYRIRFRALPVNKKAELNIHYYHLLWFAYTKSFRAEKETEALEIAENFFETNPNRSIMDYREWKKLLPPVYQNASEFEPMESFIQKSVMRNLERQLERDLEDLHWLPNLPPETTVEEDEIKVDDIPF